MSKTVQITIKGKVQGVYFRQYAKEQAIQLGLTGTIQNLSNGNVLIVASGDAQKLSLLVDWCKLGPPRAIVKKVEREEIPGQSFPDFRIIRF